MQGRLGENQTRSHVTQLIKRPRKKEKGGKKHTQRKDSAEHTNTTLEAEESRRPWQKPAACKEASPIVLYPAKIAFKLKDKRFLFSKQKLGEVSHGRPEKQQQKHIQGDLIHTEW